ncbi:hypothetical protein CJJ09_003901 [Candidozyma auris]|nr:hypothetical protein CJJ09_003901 [[Candida] auris]
MSDFPPNLSIRPLTVEDLDQCVELENKGFPEDEKASRDVESSVVKETLIGHITATKTPTQKLTKAAMELPSKENKDAGHVEFARNIAIHGLVIDPEWRGKNLGTLLMHDYIQKLSNQDLGSKVILVAHKELIPFYEKIGFEYHGRVILSTVPRRGTTCRSTWFLRKRSRQMEEPPLL